MNTYRLYLSVLFLLITGCGNNEDKKTKTTYESDTSLIFDNIEYGIIEYNGKKWLDRNLGASKACETYEGEEECWGDLYQWGRSSNGHEKRESSTTEEALTDCKDLFSEKFISINIRGDIMENADKIATAKWYETCNSVLWDEHGNGINEVCPAGWHVSTESDFYSLDIKNAQDGYKKIKIALAGTRISATRGASGLLGLSGALGSYWTSSIKDNDHIFTEIMLDNIYYNKTQNIVNGYSVRCVKND